MYRHRSHITHRQGHSRPVRKTVAARAMRPSAGTLILDDDALMAPRVMERPGFPPIEDEAVAFRRADRIELHWILTDAPLPAISALPRTAPIRSLTTRWSRGCQTFGGSRSRPVRYGARRVSAGIAPC